MPQRIRPATRLIPGKPVISGLGSLNGRVPFGITSVDATPDAPRATVYGIGSLQKAPVVSTGELLFAEIPEIVFVNGLAETDQLGIYQLDTGNRWTPGDMDRSSGWTASKQCDLIDEATGLPLSSPWLTWNKATGELYYNGDDATTTSLKARRYTVRMKYGGALSDAFVITIIRPTFTWGDSSYAAITGQPWAAAYNVTHVGVKEYATLNAAFNAKAGAAGPDVCILITPYAWNNTPSHFFDKTGTGAVYILGVPSKTDVGLTGTTVRVMGFTGFDKAVVKNLNCRATKFSFSEVPYVVMDRMDVRESFGADVVFLSNWDTTAYPYPAADPVAFFTNYLTTRAGNAGTKHPFYIHGRDQPLGSAFGGRQRCHWNNLSSYGQNNKAYNTDGSKPQGGINLKTLARYNTIRNTYLGQCDGFDAYAQTGNVQSLLDSNCSSQLISVHSHSDILLYNTHFKTFNVNVGNFGSDTILSVQDRTLVDSGVDNPAYFRKTDGTFYKYGISDPNADLTYPASPAYDPTPEWSATVDAASGLKILTAPNRTLKISWNPKVGVAGYSLKQSVSKANNYVEIYRGTGLSYDSTGLAEMTAYDHKLYTYDGNGVETLYGQLIFVTSTNNNSKTTHNDSAPYQLNPVFHGDNNYSTAPIAAPFWDTVGSTTDPQNPNLFRKFISYCRFENLILPGYTNQATTGMRDDGSSPTAPPKQLSNYNVMYNVPPNWVERSSTWAINNTFTNITTKWKPDFLIPLEPGGQYPYSVKVNLPSETRRPFVKDDGGTIESPLNVPSWFQIGSPTATVEQKTLLESIADGLAPGTYAEIPCPDLSIAIPRRDPEYPLDTPDKTRGATTWIWGDRCEYDPVTKRILGVFMSDAIYDDPRQSRYATSLQVYDERTNRYVAFENPVLQPYPNLNMTASHLYSLNAIDVPSRRLYKQSGPYYADPEGWVAPFFNVYDLGRIDINNPLSAGESGPACLPWIPRSADYSVNDPRIPVGGDPSQPKKYDQRNTVGGVLTVFPTMGAAGTLVHCHNNPDHQKVWFYDRATQTWTERQVPFVSDANNTPVWHMVGHYHPSVDKMLFGGGFGVQDDGTTVSRSFRWFTIDRNKNIVAVQDSPVVFSVFNESNVPGSGGRAPKACAVPHPTKPLSLFFRSFVTAGTTDEREVIAYDWTTGNWIRNYDVVRFRPDWCCVVPEYGTIVLGAFGADGTSKMYEYRPK